MTNGTDFRLNCSSVLLPIFAAVFHLVAKKQKKNERYSFSVLVRHLRVWHPHTAHAEENLQNERVPGTEPVRGDFL